MGLLHTVGFYWYKQVRYGMAAVLQEYMAHLEMPLNLHAWFSVQEGKFATVQMSLDCQQFNSFPYGQSRLFLPHNFSHTLLIEYFTCHAVQTGDELGSGLYILSFI